MSGPGSRAGGNTMTSPRTGGSRLYKDIKDKEAKFIKEEDEVKMADMEARLRAMVLEVVKPSVTRSAKLQTAYEHLLTKVDKHGETLQRIMSGIEEIQEASELVRLFKEQMNEFNDARRQFGEEIAQYQKDTVKRIEAAEMSCDQQKACCSRLSRSVERATDDMKAFDEDIKQMRQVVLDDLRSSREHMNHEIRRVDQSIKDADDMRQRLCDEVWGEMEPDDSSPPSFRRFDMQLRRTQAQLTQACESLAELRRLDLEMVEVHEHRAALDAQLKAQRDAHTDLKVRVEKVADSLKQDTKQAANMMAAFTANLVQDIRGNFNVEVKAIRDVHKEMDDFVKQTLDSISMLDNTCTTTGKQLEAALREMRLDLESLESRRRRDKQGVQEMVNKLEGSVVVASESSQATLRGLEHVSNVISLSLQSERMSIALDVQDFIERKDTPYVGIRHAKLTKSSRPVRGAGVDPETLVRLVYQPQPVTFQGAAVERPQLLALREKLVHAAQEVLLRGPGSPSPKGGPHCKSVHSDVGTPDSQMTGQGGVAPPLVPHALGASADLSSPLVGLGGSAGSARPRTTPSRNSISRPGSRGQPSARGSPGLEGLSETFNATVPRRAGSRGAAGAAAAWESHSTDFGGREFEGAGESMSSPHLPALADGAAGRARLASDHFLPMAAAPAPAATALTAR